LDAFHFPDYCDGAKLGPDGMDLRGKFEIPVVALAREDGSIVWWPGPDVIVHQGDQGLLLREFTEEHRPTPIITMHMEKVSCLQLESSFRHKLDMFEGERFPWQTTGVAVEVAEVKGIVEEVADVRTAEGAESCHLEADVDVKGAVEELTEVIQKAEHVAEVARLEAKVEVNFAAAEQAEAEQIATPEPEAGAKSVENGEPTTIAEEAAEGFCLAKDTKVEMFEKQIKVARGGGKETEAEIEFGIATDHRKDRKDWLAEFPNPNVVAHVSIGQVLVFKVYLYEPKFFASLFRAALHVRIPREEGTSQQLNGERHCCWQACYVTAEVTEDALQQAEPNFEEQQQSLKQQPSGKCKDKKGSACPRMKPSKVDRRADPSGGASYTWEEFSTYYQGKFTKKAIEFCWNECKPVKKAWVRKSSPK